MSSRMPNPATTVEEVFQNVPQAGLIFTEYHTDCVGCRLARFCTLAEVANVYEINLLSFLDDLQQNANFPKSKQGLAQEQTSLT